MSIIVQTIQVIVWGKPYDVEVHKKSKSVWVAHGEYMGEHHSTQDRSAATAAARWREWAQYKGNG
jgi:hypothetical protein